jgi:hypothetical protein
VANKQGVNAVLDSLWDPAERERIDPETWSRIEAGVVAGAEVAKIFEENKGRLFLRTRRPEMEQRVERRLKFQVSDALEGNEEFQALKKEIAEGG